MLVIRKVGTTIKDSTFALFLETLSKWNLHSLCVVNNSTYSITLPNKSVILFKGLDDREKLKSITGITDIWVEEASEISIDDFTQLDLRLRAKVNNLQFICSFNPVSKANFVYKKWFDNYEPDDNTLILQTTYKDNIFLPESYINSLEEMEKNNPIYYKIYALGEFAANPEGLVFHNWKKQSINPLELAKRGFQHRTGMDLGYVDPTTCVNTLYDVDTNTIYIYQEFYKAGLQLDEIVANVKRLDIGKTKLYIDSAEPRTIQFLRQNSINAVAALKGKDSVRAGISFLQNANIIVDPSCKDLIRELENFSYKKSKQTGEYTEDTTHEFSHAIDAIRYAYSDIYNKKTIKTLDKSILGL